MKVFLQLELKEGTETTWNFFYLLEKVPSENNHCDTSGNIFSIDKIGMQVNNKLDPVNKGKEV